MGPSLRAQALSPHGPMCLMEPCVSSARGGPAGGPLQAVLSPDPREVLEPWRTWWGSSLSRAGKVAGGLDEVK